MAMQRKSILSLVILWLILGLAVFGWLKRQDIYDSLRLRNYNPPNNIAQLATDTTMNASARHIFFVNHPAIENSTTFTEKCGSQGEQTIVLGCYIPPQRGIHLYDVTDARLAGVEQVTAAHEMLHAAYDRLSSQDKKQIDAWIEAAYSQITDQRIRDTITAYKKDGADTSNELHSILGTEVRNLPPELENYYKRYFADRSKIVDYSDRYESVFTSRKVQVDAYDTQLASLKKQIDDNQVALSQQNKELADERSNLDQLLASKQFEAYNNGVASYNKKVQAYNALVTTTKSVVNQYNDILEQRNAIALEQRQLFQAIDSRSVPQTVQ
jgi:hypothetical protein